MFAPHERPDIEVLVDGTWRRGELRAWLPDPHDDDHWLANVQYRLQAGTTHIETLPQEVVRPDERTTRD